jgi:hypothetical protein
MAAPMVKKFFEGIKNDIKETITPPQRALIVVDENEGVAIPPIEDAPADEADLPAAGEPSRALPVEPVDTGPEGGLAEPMEAEAPRPLRALPVGEDEVIEELFEEP